MEIDAAIKKYADQEVLNDQPEVDRSKARVTGPFNYEAVPAINVREMTIPFSHGQSLIQCPLMHPSVAPV